MFCLPGTLFCLSVETEHNETGFTITTNCKSTGTFNYNHIYTVLREGCREAKAIRDASFERHIQAKPLVWRPPCPTHHIWGRVV